MTRLVRVTHYGSCIPATVTTAYSWIRVILRPDVPDKSHITAWPPG